MKLTICICAYNAEKYLCETLDSLYRQTFRDFILWIIDDASTDGTRALAEHYFEEHQWKDARITTLPQNGGLARARNYAENHVDTEFLGFIDADDVAMPQTVEKMFSYMCSHPDCMTVSIYCEYISPASEKIGGGIFIGPTTPQQFFDRAGHKKLMFIPPCNISRVEYIRRAGCRAINGFPSGKVRYQDMCEDLDLWTRMSDFYSEGKYIVVLPEVLLRYRKMPSSMSANSRAMSSRIRQIKANLLRRRAGSPELSYVDYIAGLNRVQRIWYAYSDWSSGLYKQAGFYYLNKCYFRFFCCVCGTLLFNPGYFIQKLKKNIIPGLKKH